jgi:prepilin-type N-terminal cleavage/methylation domain-containing protein
MDMSRGFTIVELLVVVAILALLLAMFLPSLAASRASARQVSCAANARELVRANLMYGEGHNQNLAPGAARFDQNLHRWHGSRSQLSAPFEPQGGALTPFLASGASIRRCPEFQDPADGFEAGAGGYGYNNDYVGVRWVGLPSGRWSLLTDQSGIAMTKILQPVETLMFADSAFVSGLGLIEYSFAHARFQPANARVRWDPSIHFRHHDQAVVAWSDGHVDLRKMEFSWSSGFHSSDPEEYGLGWFGGEDTNRFFDLE